MESKINNLYKEGYLNNREYSILIKLNKDRLQVKNVSTEDFKSLMQECGIEEMLIIEKYIYDKLSSSYTNKYTGIGIVLYLILLLLGNSDSNTIMIVCICVLSSSIANKKALKESKVILKEIEYNSSKYEEVVNEICSNESKLRYLVLSNAREQQQ